MMDILESSKQLFPADLFFISLKKPSLTHAMHAMGSCGIYLDFLWQPWGNKPFFPVQIQKEFQLYM